MHWLNVIFSCFLSYALLMNPNNQLIYILKTAQVLAIRVFIVVVSEVKSFISTKIFILLFFDSNNYKFIEYFVSKLSLRIEIDWSHLILDRVVWPPFSRLTLVVHIFTSVDLVHLLSHFFNQTFGSIYRFVINFFFQIKCFVCILRKHYLIEFLLRTRNRRLFTTVFNFRSVRLFAIKWLVFCPQSDCRKLWDKWSPQNSCPC